MTDKDELRKLMRQRCQMLDQSTIDVASKQMWKHLVNSKLWQDAGVIHTFLPQRAEPNTFFLVNEALKTRRRMQVPKVDGAIHLTHHWLEDITLLKMNSWGIPEIQENGAFQADLSEVDLVLVPGLAFSRNGARLGQGKGYYDRFLTKLTGARTLGVGFDWQLLDHVPQEAHDQRLDGVVTECQLFWPFTR